MFKNSLITLFFAVGFFLLSPPVSESLEHYSSNLDYQMLAPKYHESNTTPIN